MYSSEKSDSGMSEHYLNRWNATYKGYVSENKIYTGTWERNGNNGQFSLQFSDDFNASGWVTIDNARVPIKIKRSFSP
jgi:hypothetical protein